MSVIPVRPDLTEVTTLLLQPSQSFSSSSSGLTGSIRLATKPSNALKSITEAGSSSVFSETTSITFDNDDLFEASFRYKLGDSNITSSIDSYLEKVEASSVEGRQYVTTYPVRFVFPNQIPRNSPDMGGDIQTEINEWTAFQRKVVQNFLIPSQINENPFSLYGYSNYHCLNFISSSNFGTASALIYPNFSNALGRKPYSPAGAFTLDFFIKPKAPIGETGSFRAGTIFHMSSSICVSLISGSQIGPDNNPETFRILLQLSQSANRQPSSINPGLLPLSSPNDLIFSSDEVLKRDTWHRVTIRWGSNTRSYGSGSIRVDQIGKSFNVNSASISSTTTNDALFIGNYYDCGDAVGKFFNLAAATDNGTDIDPDGATSDPAGYKFSHPLNAEIHHVSLFKRYLSDDQLEEINSLYSLSEGVAGPSFFLPVFFTSSVNALKSYFAPAKLDYLQTDSPVSYHLSLGYNANYLNLHNFVIDFAQSNQPRALGLTEVSELSTTGRDYRTQSLDDYLMNQTVARKRNFSILPCDNGTFEPSFEMLSSDNSSRFHSINGSTYENFISLERLAPLGTYVRGTEYDELLYDGTPNKITDLPYKVYLPLLQNMNEDVTRPSNVDLSSNRSIFFTIPAAYYLNRITPGSFVISDSSLSGSGGMSITLRDDGRGNLYRSNTLSSPAKWNRVGAIFYSHGVVAILSPHVPFFGKNGFSMSFRGEVRKTVASFTIPASPGILNSSTNQTYKSFPPTQNRSEQADDFTYITGINLHDENLNVIMRARLAQSVQKREGDELVFRLRYDF
jgi:hypothetical protein